jgi:uncharacterized SAM-dependent methyltransferase
MRSLKNSKASSAPFNGFPATTMALEAQPFLLEELRNSPTTIDGKGIKTVWFDQPYHLYLEEVQAQTYLDMISRETFVSALHGPAEQLIFRYRRQLLRGLHEPIEFYDLGPGLPKKTIPLLNELKVQDKDFVYMPVDISRSFLDITKKEVARVGVRAKELNCLFEDLPDIIHSRHAGSRLFLIGLTFNNYRPDRILALLNSLSGPNDVNIIITQFFSNRRKESILIPYKDEYAEQFNYLALKIAGIRKSHLSYFAEFRNQRIEMGFRLLDDLEVGGMWFRRGTRIVTALSYRYRKQDLIREISDYFEHCEIFRDQNQKDISLVAFRLHKHAV